MPKFFFQRYMIFNIVPDTALIINYTILRNCLVKQYVRANKGKSNLFVWMEDAATVYSGIEVSLSSHAQMIVFFLNLCCHALR